MIVVLPSITILPTSHHRITAHTRPSMKSTALYSLSREERSRCIEQMKKRFAAAYLTYDSAANGIKGQECEAEVKLSSTDSIKKKDIELNAIRAAVRPRKGGNDQINYSSERLKA